MDTFSEFSLGAGDVTVLALHPASPSKLMLAAHQTLVAAPLCNEQLVCMVIEGLMIVQEVRTGHMPVKILGLHE